MSLRSCVFTGRLRLCITQTMHQLVHFWISEINSYAIFPNREIKKQKILSTVDYTVLLLWQNFLPFSSMQGMYQGMFTCTKKVYVHLQSNNVKNWIQKACGTFGKSLGLQEHVHRLNFQSVHIGSVFNKALVGKHFACFLWLLLYHYWNHSLTVSNTINANET